MRRVLDSAALHEREVDLDDVEVDLAEQAQPGVSGTDVVRGEAHPRPTTRLDVGPQLVEVLDLLALGQLEDDPVERDVMAAEDCLQVADAELARLERPRRQVDAEID